MLRYPFYAVTSTPEMCAFKPTAEANAEIASALSNVWRRSNARTPLAATEDALRTSCVPSFIVAVIAELVVFVKTILVTTACPPDGVVYRVVSDVVKDPLESLFMLLVGIFYLR